MSETGRPGLIDIHQSFAETQEGMKLASRVRYERYKPAEVSNKRWEGLLGADVNNLDHMPLTYGLTRAMVRHLRNDQPGYLSADEEDVLQVAALIHDRGEAVTKKGDITFSDKTPEDEAEEMAQLATLLEEQSSEDMGDIKNLIMEAAEVVRGESEKLSLVFNTIERLGYVRTALRAAEHIRAGTAPDCEEGLRWIVADVFGNQIPILTDRSSEYVPIQSYLQNQAGAINEAFHCVSDDTFTKYSIEQHEQKIKVFQDAYVAWNQWETATLGYAEPLPFGINPYFGVGSDGAMG